jgi:hypothetical protein
LVFKNIFASSQEVSYNAPFEFQSQQTLKLEKINNVNSINDQVSEWVLTIPYGGILPGADGLKPNPMSPYGRPRVNRFRQPAPILEPRLMPHCKLPHRKATRNRLDDSCFNSPDNPLDFEFEYKTFIKEMKNKYPNSRISKSRFKELCTRRADGQDDLDCRGLLEARGILPFEAKGLILDIERSEYMDFKGKGQGRLKQYKFFEHTRFLASDTLHEQNEKEQEFTETAFCLGQKKS